MLECRYGLLLLEGMIGLELVCRGGLFLFKDLGIGIGFLLEGRVWFEGIVGGLFCFSYIIM